MTRTVLLQQVQRGLVSLRNPRGEEMVLQHGCPTTGDGAVELAVVQEIRERATLVAFFRAVPGRAVEAEGIRVGHALGDHRRHAVELAEHVALPRRGAGVDHFILHADGVIATLEGVGTVDADAVRAIPHERHLHFGLAIGQHHVGNALCRLEAGGTGDRRVGLAGPTGGGAVRMRLVFGQQLHRRAAGGLGLREMQQIGVEHATAIQHQLQHVGGDRDARGGGGSGCFNASGGWRLARHIGLRHVTGGRRSQIRIGGGRYGQLSGGNGGRVRRVLLATPFHPEQHRHHQPGKNQEYTGLVHQQAGSAPPDGVSGAFKEGRGLTPSRGGIVPPSPAGGNAPARRNRRSNASRICWLSAVFAAERATTTKSPGARHGKRWRVASRNTRLIRLRPTARVSTFRDTAIPSRAGVSPFSQWSVISGSDTRRAPLKTVEYSARVRTRAERGNRLRGKSLLTIGFAFAAESGNAIKR
ncbi:hypothetical protein D3C71_1067660 [compost metagenome]